MALSVDRRWVQVTSGSTSVITVSGLSFQPKFMLTQWNSRNTTGITSAELQRGLGFSDGTNQYATAYGVQDNRATTSRSQAAQRNDSVIFDMSVAGGTLTGRLSAAFTSDGYTLTPNVATGASFLVEVTVFGGTSIAAVVGSRSSPTSAGNFATTVTGITPNIVLIGHGGSRATAGFNAMEGSQASFGFGVGTSSSARWSAAVAEAGGVGTTSGGGIFRTDRVANFILPGTMTIESTFDLVSFAADTFTLNKAGSDTSRASQFGYAALALTDAPWVGTFTTQTSTGNFSSTSPGFQGQWLWAVTRPAATATESVLAVNATAGELSTGTAISSSDRGALWSHSEDGLVLGNTDTFVGRATDRVLIHADRSGADTATMAGEVDFVSFDSSGFTLNQVDADTQASLVGGVVFGRAATTSTRIFQDRRRRFIGATHGSP